MMQKKEEQARIHLIQAKATGKLPLHSPNIDDLEVSTGVLINAEALKGASVNKLRASAQRADVSILSRNSYTLLFRPWLVMSLPT